MHCLGFVLISAFILHVDSQEVYDRFSGKKSDDLEEHCSIEVRPCIPYEGSRVDGTCNNYKRPSKGSARGSYLRLLKPTYGRLGEIRKNKNGKPLPSARKVRTMIQSDGRVTSKTFNRAAAHFLEFIGDDLSAINSDRLKNTTDCCKKEDLSDQRDKCEPIPVPYDDPYLRVTSIRCMNFTRADTFQDYKCASNETDPEQINYQTPLLDLSTIYGVNENALKNIRLFEHGLLREERRKGRYVPLNETNTKVCPQNNSNSSVCYKFGFPEVGNFDLTTTTITIFFYREHNRIAKILQEINPCWKDDRLFKVARQINIATAANIYLYELMPVLLGYKNMLNYGLISENTEFVSVYDEYTDPLVYAEFEIARRFFTTMLDGRIKKYDEHYHYTEEFSLSDTLYKQELIEEETNFEELNRGTFYQSAAAVDDIQDPDISEKFYSHYFQAHDRIAADIQRGRDFGLQGYNSYRKLCGLKPAKKFKDLEDTINEEKIEALKRLYQDLEDVDLLVGIMSEDLIPGLYVGPTLFCIISKQIHIFKFSDRFWFERGKQYHSFTLPQLQEIRKTNMARFACDNAEGIKFIQPHALLNVRRGNEPVPCSHIPIADLRKWEDASCRKHHKEEIHNEGQVIYNNREYTENRHGSHVFYQKYTKPQSTPDLNKYGSFINHHTDYNSYN